MVIITEDYVSFETAKLLKEKGFDEYNPLWYDLNKSSEGPFFYKEIGWYGHNSYDYNGKSIISAPTQQMVMRWLREVHKILIVIDYAFNIKTGLFFKLKYPCTSDEYYLKNSKGGYKTYEEAVEAAIKCCLNII